MKTLILDESIWRCGGYSNNDGLDIKRGVGITCLENSQGYRCCLGQFILQLDKTIIERLTVDDKSSPIDLGIKIPLLTKKQNGILKDTELSIAAMNINDSEYITVKEKVKKLKALFKRRGVKIVFRKDKSKK